MASTSKTGHTKNVSNLKTLNVYPGSPGAQYNPTKNAIVLARLQALHTNAGKALAGIRNAFPTFAAAVDEQEALFKPLNKLVSRVVRAYRAAVDNPAEAETAISLQKKINGKGKKTNPRQEPKEGEDPISTSQLSYDNRQANFKLPVKQWLPIRIISQTKPNCK